MLVTASRADASSPSADDMTIASTANDQSHSQTKHHLRDNQAEAKAK
jgi:hypothetical protein